VAASEAWEVIKQATDYDRRAGFGPWTLLGDEAQGLQIQLLRGENDLVVRRVFELREQMKLIDEVGPHESVEAWNVRELIMDIGHTAALQLGDWEQALNFRAEISASEQGRGAAGLEQAGPCLTTTAPCWHCTATTRLVLCCSPARRCSSAKRRWTAREGSVGARRS
jgi:hypothetical protein